MKLKKIASLMLAGIMAVSMLAGCKSGTPDPDDNGGASSNTTSSFTQSVLDKTDAATKLVLSASTNDKLDRAVAYAAKNHVEVNYTNETFAFVEQNWQYKELADSVMNAADVQYVGNINGLTGLVNTISNGDKDGTAYILYTVSRKMSDEWIENELAGMIDTWATQLTKDNDTETFDYTIRVAKADSLNGDKADRTKDVVLVGVAITVDYEKVTY